MGQLLVWSLFVGLFVNIEVLGVKKSDLYPYGVDQQDRRLEVGDDLSSNEVYLQTSIAFYDDLHSSIFVNMNGILSFGTDMSSFQSNLVIPFGNQVIAPFFADVDISLSGNVYYRETADPALLQKAAYDVRRYFTETASAQNFRPSNLFIVTWDDVGYYNSQFDPVNSFQVVIASDGTSSYAFFHYPDNGINWLTGMGKNPVRSPDIPAQAGFDAGDRRRSVILPKSGSPEIRNLDKWSNVNVPGLWMFKIGNTQGGNIESPKSDSGRTPAKQTCSNGGKQTCSSNSQCMDYEEGFCCHCNPGHYGNGINCLRPGDAQRVSGKVKGTINNQYINSVDLHAYIVTNDGRSFTAISRFPSTLLPSMQSLYAVGDVLGWSFALPLSPKAKNGYAMTGGDFNRTLKITFSGNAGQVTVNQVAKGSNAQGFMIMDTELDGSIPAIPEKSKVIIEDFTQEYRRESKGLIRSFSTRTYQVDGIRRRFTVDETITYNECEARPFDDVGTMRLSVNRAYVGYSTKDEIVRFATTNRIGKAAGANPCRDAGLNCDSNADCTPSGPSHECRCRQGFSGDGLYCQDIDECADRTNDCHPELSTCTNTAGSFQCVCLPGFKGDGKRCARDQSCAGKVCHPHARCVYDSDAFITKCECQPGFRGDGINVCTQVDDNIIEFGCNDVSNCDPYAECIFDEEEQRYACQCVDGYSGDGFQCTDSGELELSCSNCDINSECVYDIYRLTFLCQCNAGYTGDGYTCSLMAEQDCSVLNNCDRNARCVYNERSFKHECECVRDYHGDGYRCDPDTCDIARNCHQNAQCLFDRQTNMFQCLCNQGFEGNGLLCVEESCNVRNFCDDNAECTYDYDSDKYQCQCNEGYEGDGKSCTQSAIQCNQLNNCDPNADCLFDRRTNQYTCRCREGYDGDGVRCTLTANCRDNPNLCDVNARCQRSGLDFVCVCEPGFRGDGYRCTSISAAGNYLLVNQGISILEVPFEANSNSAGKVLMQVPGQLAVGIDVDCYERYFYWTDAKMKIISRAKMDGTESDVMITGLNSPEGVAIDWVSRNMYYTDSGADSISVAKLDGSEYKVLVSTGLVNPRAIQVDPIRGVMFWTDWNRNSPKIERSNMDGTERVTLVSEGLGLPNGLTLDTDNERVCWADAGTKKVECTGYEPDRPGSRHRLIYNQANYPFAITHANGNFYWTDWQSQTLPHINEFAQQPGVPLALPLGGNGKLYGLVAVKDQCPRGTNACAYNNGGCRFLCLPTANGRHTCACPDNVEEEECNRIGLVL